MYNINITKLALFGIAITFCVHHIMMLSRILLALAFSSLANGLSTVVYGPQSRELLLLSAKLAAREGLDTSCVCAGGTEGGCRRLMYGTEYADAEKDEPGRAKPVSSGEDIGAALEKANSLIFICYDSPIDEKSVDTLLGATGDDLSKVVLLSKMGVTKAKGGFFGGGDSKLIESEKILANACKSKNLAFSIVRAGNLKGGGPGGDESDFGLDRCYYNTIIDVVEAKVTMAVDKYTVGAECTKGDTIERPNMFSQMGTKSSFDPCPYETNRVVAAGATVAAALYEDPIEFSVSTEKGTEPLTMDAWKEKLAAL
jgi:hypothetical protein